MSTKPLPDLKQRIASLIASPSISSFDRHWDSGNGAVIEHIQHWLTALGFKVEVFKLKKSHPAEADKYNLLATLGCGPGGLVLSGHTDTVPFDEARWQSDPFRLHEDKNRWYGLGSCDMKGFFSVAIEAAIGLRAEDMKQPLMILATADEESSMAGARQLAAQGFPKARYAVIGEPTSLQPIRMHKGITMESLVVEGQSGHSSNPDLGHSALDSMHQVMSALIDFRQELAKKHHQSLFTVPHPTLNLGCIHGGDNPNRICGRCELQFDLRALPGMNNDELRAQIDAELTSIGERTQTRIERKSLFGEVPPFVESSDSVLVKLAEQLSGHSAGSAAFATEAPFLQNLGMQTLVMGPGSIDLAHQPNEYLAIDQVQSMVRHLRAMISRLCLQGESD